MLILLAIGVGAFRLLVTQLPSYQGEVQSWAREALGLSVTFAHVDARWSLRGPEITLHDAIVSRAADGSEPIVSAREASIGLSAIALFTERRLAVNRLTLDGTRLTLERAMDGSLRLQGAPSDDGSRRGLVFDELPAVAVIVRDSSVVFEDAIRQVSWEFQDVRLELGREADGIVLEARASAPASLGTRIELSAEGRLPRSGQKLGGAWRVFAEVRDLDVSALPSLFPAQEMLPEAGIGDVSVWLELAGGQIVRGTAQLALEELRLARTGSSPAAGTTYERLEMTAEWTRIDGGWQAALSDLELRRNERAWPGGVSIDLRLAVDAAGLAGMELRSNFLRLEDLTPVVATLHPTEAAGTWLALAPHGDVSDLELRLDRRDGQWEYSTSAGFEEIGVTPHLQWPGVTRLSGELRTDSRSGRLAVSTTDALIDWPAMFREPLQVDQLTGILVWRQGRGGIRLVSDDLTLSNRDLSARSSLEFTYPLDGSSPSLELEADVFHFDVAAAGRYLPAPKMPASIVRYLDRAILGGRVTAGQLTFFGPLSAFPFDGSEGQLQAHVEIEDGSMAFVADWPVAEDLAGTIDFLNAGWVARGSGRILRNQSSDVRVGIADMRDAVLTVQANTSGPLEDVLAFLKGSPLIARHLGPDLARLQAGAGIGEIALDLSMPLLNRPAFELDADLTVVDGELAIEGFGPSATDIQGLLTLEDGAVRGEGIEATLLDGPVVAHVGGSEEPGYRARIDFEGEVAAESVREAFDLPFSTYLAGQTRWQGNLLLPANNYVDGSREPVKISIGSNLSGVALRFPPPLSKSPGEPTSFELNFTFFESDRLDVDGHLGATRRFVLSFWNREGELAFRRGGVRFGGSYPLLPPSDGLSVSGSLGQLWLDDWWELLKAGLSEPRHGHVLQGARLEIADFAAFGQRLGATELAIRQDGEHWLVDIASDPVAGRLSIPMHVSQRPQIIAEMQKLSLAAASPGGAGDADPRGIPGALIHAEDFAVGQRRFGRLSADIHAEPLGLRMVSFHTESASFALEGSGGWFDGSEGQTTRLAVTLTSHDVAATLAELALEPIAVGEFADVTASIHWPGGPSADWRQAVSGDLSLRLEEGSVLDIDPGAGRMMGLMSITALPRRLALDFRDVFNRGLVFDAVDGDFVIIEGNAYTDNLKLTGPVADIGLAGRTGLRDEDYQQHAVVTAEPGKVLPTMGFFAGPGVGAALLLFTQIFKEPLKGIGRASYCVTGSWYEPSVERLTPAELQAGRLCAELPPGRESPIRQQRSAL